MYWSLLFYVTWLAASPTNGQRRAAIDYPVTSPEEVEAVSENPLSSSINSIQTGRDELIGFHRGDPFLGSPVRRGNHKATTLDYFKESATSRDNTNVRKGQHAYPTKPPEVDGKTGVDEAPGNRDGDGAKVPRVYEVPTETQRSEVTVLTKGESRSSSELPSSASSVRLASIPKLDHSEAETSSEKKDEVKESMDIANKGVPSREPTRRTNTHEPRRQAVAQSSSSSSRYNTTLKDSSERHREEFSGKNQNERLNTERRHIVSAENARGHRTVTRSTPDKGQILTHTSTQRIPPAGQRHDRTEQSSASAGAHDRKVSDRPSDNKDSSFRSADERKKDLDGESDSHDKVYRPENEGVIKVREDRTNSTVVNKPTHLLIGEERAAGASPDVYRDEFGGGGKIDSSGKVGSDIEKSSGGGEGKIYVERPYVRDDDGEKSPGYQVRDTDRDYTRRHRDRYDERSYEESLLKDRQEQRDRERNATYNFQGRTANRSSRPRDRDHDEEYRDDVYSQRDAVKDDDNNPRGRTRVTGRRPYSRTDDDVDDRDRYARDGTRNYRDYSDDRRYRDEPVPVDRDSSRRFGTEESRKYREDGRRTYDDDDDYGDKDRYNRRYEKGGESVRYGDDTTRRYVDSGYRRYEDEETRRSQTDYDRPVRRYKDDDDYSYNSTHRYKENYDGYRDENRRSSGESGSSSRYDENDGTRSIRYDDEEYVGNRGYRARDSDRRYVSRDDDGSSRRRNVTRKYVRDDVSVYSEADEDRRYGDETRVYTEGSLKDRYDQDNRRTFEGDGSAYARTRPYRERFEPTARREYDDVTRHRDNNGSRRSHGDESYRSRQYDDDEYYINRTSIGYADRYDDSGRPKRRTDDDSSGFATSDDDNRKYTSRSNDEGRRDRDRVYADIPVSRRRTDTDDTLKDKDGVYDEDRRSDRSRTDSYDDRTYRSRDDEGYIRSSRDGGKNYDTRVYRDSDDEVDPRNYRVKGEGDVNGRHRGDVATGGRVTDDELKKTRPVSGRNRDKDYIDRRHEEGYRDKGPEGTYRYREEEERYKNTPPEDRKTEYADSEKRNRGTQRFRDDYDAPYDRDFNTPRNTDERRRGGDRPKRREDLFVGDRTDFDDKAPERPPITADAAVRRDIEFPASRNDDSLLKGERSRIYDEERRRNGMRSPSRDIQPDAGIPRTQYASDDVPPKPRVSESSADSLDKGDFARGRRTSFYNEDDKTDSDRDEAAKRTRADRHLSRIGDSGELSYSHDEKGSVPSDEKKDLRQTDRSNSRPDAEGHAYSNRREATDTSRQKSKDEIQPSSRVPSDLLPTSIDKEYSERSEDIAKPTISQSTEESQRRRYSSSSYDRGSRRRLPNVRESDVDRTKRRDELEYKPEDSLLPENRGRYRYTKSRGDREDFVHHPDEGPSTAPDEYTSRGTSSKGRDGDRRDTLKGEYGSPGSGTPPRSKEDRIPSYAEHRDKEEYYPSSGDKMPPLRSGKPVDDAQAQREFDRREKVPHDRDSVRGERGMYGRDEYPRSSPQDEIKFSTVNMTRDHFASSGGEVRAKKESDHISPVLSQTASSVRGQVSSVSRSATPIPNYQDKEFISRNVSSRNSSDRFLGVAVNREKRFQLDDRHNTSTTSRSVTGMSDELSKRPLTPKEVIEAAYRHSDEPEKQREIFYPVYVPGSSNMTSPDIIRPSERRGITTPTKKKKKK